MSMQVVSLPKRCAAACAISENLPALDDALGSVWAGFSLELDEIFDDRPTFVVVDIDEAAEQLVLPNLEIKLINSVSTVHAVIYFPFRK